MFSHENITAELKSRLYYSRSKVHFSLGLLLISFKVYMFVHLLYMFFHFTDKENKYQRLISH